MVFGNVKKSGKLFHIYKFAQVYAILLVRSPNWWRFTRARTLICLLKHSHLPNFPHTRCSFSFSLWSWWSSHCRFTKSTNGTPSTRNRRPCCRSQTAISSLTSCSTWWQNIALNTRFQHGLSQYSWKNLLYWCQRLVTINVSNIM